MAIKVGQARKKFGVTYPALYAPPGHKDELVSWVCSNTPNTECITFMCSTASLSPLPPLQAYNCVQRAHQVRLAGGLRRIEQPSPLLHFTLSLLTFGSPLLMQNCLENLPSFYALLLTAGYKVIRGSGCMESVWQAVIGGWRHVHGRLPD